MAYQLEYTSITPKQSDETTLVFTLNRALTPDESQFFTDRRLTASGATVEVRMEVELEPDVEDAARAAIGRVDVVLRDLEEKARLEALPESERPPEKSRQERVEAVVEAQLDKKAREKQARERGERGTERPRA